MADGIQLPCVGTRGGRAQVEVQNVFVVDKPVHEAESPSRMTYMKLLTLDFLSQKLLDRGGLLKHTMKSTHDQSTVRCTPKKAAVTLNSPQGKHASSKKPGGTARMTHRNQLVAVPLMGAALINVGANITVDHMGASFDYYAGQLRSISKKAHMSMYFFVEKEIMNFFGLTLPKVCDPPEKDIGNEKKAVKMFADYIHSVEYMLHFLSSKPASYAHLLLIALLALLRNLMFIIQQQESSIMLVEFTILCSDALKLTQHFICTLCTAPQRKTPKEHEQESEFTCAKDDENSMGTLKAMLGRCNTYRDTLITLCKDALKEYGSMFEYEMFIPRTMSSSPCGNSRNSNESLPVTGNGSESYISSIYKEARSYESQDEGQRKSCRALSTFSRKVGSLISKWRNALCDFAGEANRNLPASLLRKYRNIALQELAGSPALLYRQVKGSSLSLIRDPALAKLITEGSSNLLKTTDKGQYKLLTPLEMAPLCKRRSLDSECDLSISCSYEEARNTVYEGQTTENHIADRCGKRTPTVSSDTELAEPSALVTTDSAPEIRSNVADIHGQYPNLQEDDTMEVFIHLPSQSPRSMQQEILGTIQFHVPESTTSTSVSLSKPTVAQEKPTENVAHKVRKDRKWQREDVIKLVDVINKHGAGRWAFFSYTYFGGRKTGPQLKDKWCNLTRYKHVYQVPMDAEPGVPRRTCWKIADSV